MRIALCQLNSTTGDTAGNSALVKRALQELPDPRPDLAVFPELFIEGYPPRDLLEHEWFLEQSDTAVQELCRFSTEIAPTGILIGVARRSKATAGKGLTNSAVLIHNGKIVFQQDKSLLPTYDVFDESRYFDVAKKTEVVPFAGERLGITICEDAWNASRMWDKRTYELDPVEELVKKGATLLINVSGSPFHLGKQKTRFDIMRSHAVRHKIPFLFVNQVGGNDELVFDGTSLAFDPEGSIIAQLPAFTQSIVVVDTATAGASSEVIDTTFDSIESVHGALVLGLRDYVQKCGFKSVLVGLSGGIDSAVTCALACDAIGPENVFGITMPSQYSSSGSVTDSEALAKNLGISLTTIPIKHPFDSFLELLRPHFRDLQEDITEENLQARTRGNILMAFSNKFGHLLLSTGNKSEMAVGYCTLYGDMNGGLSVISDLPKTKVYELAHYLNKDKERIPPATIEKAPSAELRPDQKDQDSLPPYETLDRILQLFIEERRSKEEIVETGITRETVEWVLNAVKRSEYKRRQAAPGLKVTPKAFGSGRRFPIAARYHF